MKQKTYRQGDVLIERVTAIPAEVMRQSGKIILATGEATGHHHALELECDRDADWWKTADETQYLDIKVKAAAVKHQEHAPVMLPRGLYRVRRQVEYTPAAIVKVTD